MMIMMMILLLLSPLIYSEVFLIGLRGYSWKILSDHGEGDASDVDGERDLYGNAEMRSHEKKRKVGLKP